MSKTLNRAAKSQKSENGVCEDPAMELKKFEWNGRKFSQFFSLTNTDIPALATEMKGFSNRTIDAVFD